MYFLEAKGRIKGLLVSIQSPTTQTMTTSVLSAMRFKRKKEAKRFCKTIDLTYYDGFKIIRINDDIIAMCEETFKLEVSQVMVDWVDDGLPF